MSLGTLFASSTCGIMATRRPDQRLVGYTEETLDGGIVTARLIEM